MRPRGGLILGSHRPHYEPRARALMGAGVQ